MITTRRLSGAMLGAALAAAMTMDGDSYYYGYSRQNLAKKAPRDREVEKAKRRQKHKNRRVK